MRPGLVMADQPRVRQQFMLITVTAAAAKSLLLSSDLVVVGFQSKEEWGIKCFRIQ